MQPSDLKADRRPERFAGIEIGSAGLIEPAADFGEADDDDEDAGAGEQDGRRTPGAGERGQRRGKTEDAAADDAIDDDGGERPSADGADERDGGGWMVDGRAPPHRRRFTIFRPASSIPVSSRRRAGA